MRLTLGRSVYGRLPDQRTRSSYPDPGRSRARARSSRARSRIPEGRSGSRAPALRTRARRRRTLSAPPVFRERQQDADLEARACLTALSASCAMRNRWCSAATDTGAAHRAPRPPPSSAAASVAPTYARPGRCRLAPAPASASWLTVRRVPARVVDHAQGVSRRARQLRAAPRCCRASPPAARSASPCSRVSCSSRTGASRRARRGSWRSRLSRDACRRSDPARTGRAPRRTSSSAERRSPAGAAAPLHVPTPSLLAARTRNTYSPADRA